VVLSLEIIASKTSPDLLFSSLLVLLFSSLKQQEQQVKNKKEEERSLGQDFDHQANNNGFSRAFSSKEKRLFFSCFLFLLLLFYFSMWYVCFFCLSHSFSLDNAKREAFFIFSVDSESSLDRLIE